MEHWLAAMALEVKSLEAMGTWTLVDRPQSRKVIPRRCVLAVKRDAMGQVEWFKARYIVKGFRQVERLDFNETFAPTCEPETKRILLALGAQDDLVLHSMDIKSAFLNSPLAETCTWSIQRGSAAVTTKCACYNEVSMGCGRQEETGIRR